MIAYLKKEFDKDLSDKDTKLDYIFIFITAIFVLITVLLIKLF